MLVLTRRIGESISIGGDITIKIISVSGKQARLGIDARSETPIFRSEIFEQLCQAVRVAKDPSLDDVDKAARYLNELKYFEDGSALPL